MTITTTINVPYRNFTILLDLQRHPNRSDAWAYKIVHDVGGHIDYGYCETQELAFQEAREKIDAIVEDAQIQQDKIGKTVVSPLGDGTLISVFKMTGSDALLVASEWVCTVEIGESLHVFLLRDCSLKEVENGN